MRILVWNVRGCNKTIKQKEIRVLLQSQKISIAALLETRVKIENSKKIMEKVGRGWSAVNNYDKASNGRVWILWDPKKVSITVIQTHAQAICCEIVDVETGQGQYFVAVYALNTMEQRKELWNFLKSCMQLQGPIFISGDFNAILHSSDRLNGSQVTSAEMEDFKGWVQESEVVEIRALGPHLTWCNNQMGEDRISTNIDRSFANL